MFHGVIIIECLEQTNSQSSMFWYTIHIQGIQEETAMTALQQKLVQYQYKLASECQVISMSTLHTYYYKELRICVGSA